MNKVHDLVSVNVATAMRMFNENQRYELIPYLMVYIRDVIAVCENRNVPRTWDFKGLDMRFEPFLFGVYENFYMGAKAMWAVAFSPDGTEVETIVADRAQRAASSLHGTILDGLFTRIWDEDVFMSDCFSFLWMSFFAALIKETLSREGEVFRDYAQ
jgi:hypothetical protein